MHHIITMQVKRVSDGQEKIIYLSDRGLTNAPSGTPANQIFEPRLIEPLGGRFDMFDRLTTYGGTNTGFAELRINNNDGVFDWLLTDYTVNGSEVHVYIGDESANVFPTQFQLVQLCRAVLATADDKEIRVEIRDKIKLFDKPLLPNKYLGNNALPAGAEGTKDDLKDRRKPRVYGKVENIAPYYVNTSRLIYQVSDRPCTVNAVYSRGVAWASDGTYAAFADLQNDALEPAQSKYKVYSGSEGTYFRLGSIPAGTVTCDAQTTDILAGDLLEQIALDMGVSLSDISATDVAALNAIGYDCGAWATEEITGLQALNEIASSVGAYCRFDGFGVLRLQRLTPPDVSHSFDVPPWLIIDLKLIKTADTDEGAPAWRVNLKYRKNYTVQDDLGNTAATARAAFASEEYRIAKAENATTKTIYEDSPEVEIVTSLIDEADAQSEAARYLSLLGQQRFVYEITMGAGKPSDISGVSIGDTVRVTYPRFNLSTGKNFRVIGIVYNVGQNVITLRLWG